MLSISSEANICLWKTLCHGVRSLGKGSQETHWEHGDMEVTLTGLTSLSAHTGELLRGLENGRH